MKRTKCITYLTLFLVLLINNLASAEWIEITQFYGQETIYNDMRKYFPQFDYKAGYGENGKIDVKYMFDHKLQIFPCGPLKAWFVAYKGRKYLSVYHFINHDGSNVKLTGGNSSIDKGPKPRRRKKSDPLFPIEKGVDSLLPPRGIERFDLIVGANGKLFDQPQSQGLEGEYGPIYDLAMAVEKGQATGKMSLMVRKPGDPENKPPRNVLIKMDKLPPFSKTFPARCRRSDMIETELLNILAEDSETPRLSNGISQPMVGLAMLASGQKKYLPAIENYALHLANWFVPGGVDANAIVTRHQGSGWKSGFTLIFLAEYFWATGDMRVFPILQRLAYDADEFHHNAFGSAGHGAHGIGTYFSLTFGPPNGLNAFGAALAEKTGAKVNAKLYSNYWYSMTRSIDQWVKDHNDKYRFVVENDKDYYTCYGHGTFERTLQRSAGALQSINTSTAALALLFNKYKNPNVKKLALKLNDNMIYTYKINSYIHTTPNMGHFFSQMSLNAYDNKRPLNSRVIATFNEPYANKYAGQPIKGKRELGDVRSLTAHDAWRKIMDYRKYLLIHSRFDKDTYYYFIPRCQNSGAWGGDGYANLHGSALYNLLGIVVSDKRDFMMYGGKTPCWMVTKDKKEAFQAGKKMKAAMIAYHKKYSAFLVKYAKFVYNGGVDASKLKQKSRANSEKLAIYRLLAYEIADRITQNYRGYPAASEAKKLCGMILKKFGGKKKLDSRLKNLDGLRKIDYACTLHERRNMKSLMNTRKDILKLVQKTCVGLPAAKIAVAELEMTQKVEAALGDKDRLEIKEGNPLFVPRKVPYIDVNQMK